MNKNRVTLKGFMRIKEKKIRLGGKTVNAETMHRKQGHPTMPDFSRTTGQNLWIR